MTEQTTTPDPAPADVQDTFWSRRGKKVDMGDGGHAYVVMPSGSKDHAERQNAASKRYKNGNR